MKATIKIGLSVLLAAVAMNGSLLGVAQALTSQKLVEKVEAVYAQTKDLQADFTQETRFEGFETGFSSSGKVYLKKPGLLRWEYLQPSKEQIFVEGDQVMMYVPDHQQVVKGTLTQMAASKGPLALLQGAGTLSQQFTIIEPSGEPVSESNPVLTLEPKPSGHHAPTLKKIELRLMPDSYLIGEITLFETSGNVSRVTFDHIQVNKGIPLNIFQFDVPSDVVVVEMPVAN